MFQGDEGGALVFKRGNSWTQIGILSLLPIGGCASGNPTAYVRVTSYLQWIKDISGVSE
jgi:secreted trypsin-like serine protease